MYTRTITNCRRATMTIATHEGLITTAETFVQDHDCTYANYLMTVDRRMGSTGIRTVFLQGHGEELERIHADNTCPPTHVDTSPTLAWSDWTKDLKVI